MKKEFKKKGFTLIEVLAVIVVLAIIALITTPIILNVMDKAKKGALEDSAYGLLESANLYYAEGTLENNQAKTEFTFKDGIQTSENKLSYKGKVENGSVRLYSDGKSALCITGGNYAAVKNVNDKKVSVVKGKCSYNTETEEYETIGLCKDLQDELDCIKGLGDATSKDILIDKTAYVKGQLITGSMKNNETVNETINPGESYTIPEGYHNGNGKVTASKTGTGVAKVYLTSPVDIKADFPDTYRNMTADDFLVGSTGAQAFDQSDSCYVSGGYFDGTCSKNYDAATGILTFSGYNNRSGNEQNYHYIHSTGTVFAVYLGTVGGK